MFTILSLFTEDVKLRHGGSTENETGPQGSAQKKPTRFHSPIYGESPQGHPEDDGKTISGSLPNGKPFELPLQEVPFIPLLNPSAESPEEPPNSNSVHPGIIARANIDTTIAVIPAQVTSIHMFVVVRLC